ncbi:hypothetical protein ACU686_19615 [Yinghuangia aomiensis]
MRWRSTQCAARHLYAIGREGFIHPSLGKAHRTHGSLHIASVVQTVITVLIVTGFLLADMDPVVHVRPARPPRHRRDFIVQTLCSFAAVGYFHVQGKHPETKHWFKTLVAPVVAGVAMIGVVGLLFINESSRWRALREHAAVRPDPDPRPVRRRHRPRALHEGQQPRTPPTSGWAASSSKTCRGTRPSAGHTGTDVLRTCPDPVPA